MRREAAEPLEAALRAIADAQKIPGFQLTIAHASGPLWGLSYGVTEVSGGSQISLTTRFPLASVTKVATALAVHAEVGAGTLSLESPLRTLLPDVDWSDARADEVTLRHLLSHTAGLGDFDPIAWADDEAKGDDALESSVRAFAQRAFVTAPGEQYRYSNAGYDVAGLALARAVGTSFEEALETCLLGPLGMSQSSFYPHGAEPLAPPAVGHVGDGFGGVVAYRGSIGSRSHAPCGTLASTGDDLGRWMVAMLGADRAALPIEDLATPIASTGRADGAVSCLGVRRRMRYGAVVLEHGGWDPGFRCALVVLPERGVAACLLTNYHWSSPLMMECCLDVLQERPVTLDEAVLEELRAPPPPGRGAG